MPSATEEVPFDHLTTAGHQPRHRAAKAAYNAGRRGRGFSIDQTDVADMAALRELYERGEADRAADRQQLETVRAESSSPPATTRQPKTAELPAGGPASTPAGEPPPRPRPARRAPRAQFGGGAPQVVNDGAGFLLGLVAYALLINFLRGGREQARGWIAAKFLNRPYGAAQATPAKPASPAGPTYASPAGPTYLSPVGPA